MNLTQIISTIFLSSLFLTACGGSSDAKLDTGTDTDTNSKANLKAYEGTWLGQCFNNGSTSSQTTLIFDSGSKSGKYIVKNHVGSSCGASVNLISEIDVNGTYPKDFNSSICQNASEIDIVIREPIKITDVTGYGGFPAGTVKTYTVAEFEALTALSGQTLNDHIQLYNIICNSDDGTKMYGGLVEKPNNDGSSAAKRPKELSVNYPFIRQ